MSLQARQRVGKRVSIDQTQYSKLPRADFPELHEADEEAEASLAVATPLLASDPILPRAIPLGRTSRTVRRIVIASLAMLCLLAAIGGWDTQQPESRTKALLKHTGLVKPDLGLGRVSQHRELVSVVLMVGNNDHGVLEVVLSLLAMTVGPYELIGVFTEPKDSSQRIVSMIADQHSYARVDRHGRGLQRFRAVNVTSDMPDYSSAVLLGIRQAKGDHVAIINADDKVYEYGWDRILLTGLRSDPSLLAVSGKAAANVHVDDGKLAFTDITGQIDRQDHDVMPSPSHIDIRNVAFRSPIMYDAVKARTIDWMDIDMEAEGLGDVDMCLRGQVLGYVCGYYPVSTKTKEEWKVVPGSLPAVEDSAIPLSHTAHAVLDVLIEGSQSITTTFSAIPREVEDVPKTIVTAFSGNHQHTVQQWYHTLDQSPHTRYIAYILPSDITVDPETYASWTGVEVRVFDFSRWPDWMDVTRARGEYAWKGVIVEEVIRDYGGLVFWMDAGNEITDDFTQTWREVADLGVFGISVGGPISLWTHPGTVAYLSLPPSIMDGNNCNGAMWAVNSQHFDAMNKIIRPYIECVKTRECVAPLGSNRSNHRQDQAALSALIHLHGYRCDSHAPIRMGGDAPGDGSKFCQDENGNWGEC